MYFLKYIHICDLWSLAESADWKLAEDDKKVTVEFKRQ